ncbi:sulfatase-like hydrolase/transferase [Candidatus Saccharibacteria bacterium]|nr:sulfatase-like hydrolase/transferase [Candidatus Saccharibacteria bacterium]
MHKFTKQFYIYIRAAYIIFIRWGILILGTIFLMWYLQYRVANNDAKIAWNFWDEKPTIFWYSSLILFCLIAIVYGVTHRPFTTLGIGFAVITIITYINNTKMDFRGTPLLPEDFQLADQAGTLTKFIDFSVLTKIILASVLSVMLGLLSDYLTRERLRILPALPKVPKKKPKTMKARIRRNKILWCKVGYFIGPRIVIIPLAVVSFLGLTKFITHRDSNSYQEVDWLDNTQFVMWNQTINYENNGFLLGFIYNFNKATLEVPEGYSKNKIAEIKSDYQKEAEKDNLPKKSLKDKDFNIVIILNESFYDTSFIRTDYPFEGPDPLPTFHKLMTEYPSGYMYSTDYGGGTANIEFEVDTGLSNYWAQTVPYTDILPKIKDIMSVAKEAKSAGYKTTAIHSFTGGMYKRDFALEKEGFDTFITETEMEHREHDGESEYINDQSIYQETIDVLKDSKEKQLISVITMQNHAPYVKSNYKEEEYLFSFSDQDVGSEFGDAISSYLQSVHSSDIYLGEFLQNLKKLDEKTVVLFYGDHAPGLFAYAHQLQTKEIADLTQLTPYFVWYNFELSTDFANKKYGEEFLEKFGSAYDNSEAQDVITKISKRIKLPTTTPNCLPNTLYGVLDLKLTAAQQLLSQVCKEVPILSHLYLGKTSPSGMAVKNYELLNYDILGGEQYWLKSSL